MAPIQSPCESLKIAVTGNGAMVAVHLGTHGIQQPSSLYTSTTVRAHVFYRDGLQADVRQG